jgi:hypothetical protein
MGVTWEDGAPAPDWTPNDWEDQSVNDSGNLGDDYFDMLEAADSAEVDAFD